MSKNKKFSFYVDFELSPKTAAIIPFEYGSKIYSKVIEEDNEWICPYKPMAIIKKSCNSYAASYSGRRDGTKVLIGVTHKAPIVIDPVQSIYFFPTASPTKQHCAWISFNNVSSYHKMDKKKTEVIFTNKRALLLDVSHYTFDQQYKRTASLQAKMLQRLREFNKNNMLSLPDLQTEAAERQKSYLFFPDKLKD